MRTGEEHIRVSDDVKRKLDHRRREGESYDDVLERVLDEERALLSGFGRWSDEQAERVRERRERAKEKRKSRMRRLTDDS